MKVCRVTHPLHVFVSILRHQTRYVCFFCGWLAFVKSVIKVKVVFATVTKKIPKVRKSRRISKFDTSVNWWSLIHTYISTKGFLYRGSTHLPVSLCASANQRRRKPKVKKAMFSPKKLTFWGNDPLRGKVYLTKTCYIRLSIERVSI